MKVTRPLSARSMTLARPRFAPVALFCALSVMVGCVSLGRLNAARDRGQLTESERVAHVLSRLTFGARPGDVQRVSSIGVDRWIDQQLHPESIPDSATTV